MNFSHQEDSDDNQDPSSPNVSDHPQFPAALVEQSFLERHGISPVLFAYLSLLIVFFLYQIVGGILSAFLFLGEGIIAAHATTFRVTTVAAQIVFLFIPTLILTRFADSNPQKYLRVQSPQRASRSSLAAVFLLPLFGIFSLQQMFQVYLSFQEKIPLPEKVRPLVEDLMRMIEQAYSTLITATSLPEFLFVVFVVAVVPAIAEELLFRGLIQRSFERGLGATRGVVLTAVIFAMYHLNPFSLLPLVGLGLYLGFLVHRSNSIWTSVAAHFYNNLFACTAVYLKLGENYVVTGDPAALSTSSLLLIFFSFSMVFLLSTYYFVIVTRTAPIHQQT